MYSSYGNPWESCKPPITLSGTVFGINGFPVPGILVIAFVDCYEFKAKTDCDGDYYLEIPGEFACEEITVKVITGYGVVAEPCFYELSTDHDVSDLNFCLKLY